MQDWRTRDKILELLERHFLVVAPVHLVGLALSGEIGQECCNCCKTRNKLVIVANKIQELPSSLHFARIWLDDHGLLPGWRTAWSWGWWTLCDLVVALGGSIGTLIAGRSGMKQMRQSALRGHLPCEFSVGHR